MTVIQSLVLSVVEGLTEFLPVSSTAHLVLASQILNISQSDFVKSFEVIIQLGAILAVVVIYFKELLSDNRLWFRIILAFLPSAVLGYFLYDFIKSQLIGNGLITSLALIIGGLAFMAIDRLITVNSGSPVLDNPRLVIPKAGKVFQKIETLSPFRLVLIGLFQSLAMIPGVSRSAASIFGGLLMGLNKTDATKFSFFLAIPTMLAATTLDLYKSQLSFSQNEMLVLLVGFSGSFITALIAVKAFIKFVQKHSFLPFGIYRIVIGLFWLFAIIKL